MFPLKTKQTVIDCVFEYLDNVDPCHEFSPSEVQVYVSYRTNGRCKPQDGTVTRYFRMYNERRAGGFVMNTSKHKSRYRVSRNNPSEDKHLPVQEKVKFLPVQRGYGE